MAQPPHPIVETLQDEAFAAAVAQGLDALAQYMEADIRSSSNAAEPTSPPPPPLPPRPKASPALDLYSIKASVCHHHIRYASALPWSGSCLDFDTRYCEKCRERERMVKEMVAADVPEMEMQVDGEGLMAGAKAEARPMFCESFTESPEAMSEDESLVAKDFDGNRAYFKSGLRGGNGFDAGSMDGSSDYQYLSSDSGAGSGLFEEGNQSEYDGDDEDDGDDQTDEPMSPALGVSFSPGHFWVGEDMDL